MTAHHHRGDIDRDFPDEAPKLSKKHTILFVDDEVCVLDALRRALPGQRDVWNMHFAQSVDEAMEKVTR